MSYQTEPILIVGARPAGLALAIALLKDGIKARVVRLPGNPLQQQTSNTILHPSMLSTLNYIDVTNEILQHSTPAQTTSFHELGVTTTLDIAASIESPLLRTFTFSDHSTESGRVITLGTLTQILETRLVALGGRVEKETEIVTVSRDEGNDSIICLLRARGTALNGNQRGRVPREVFIRCEWLIDTDGSEGPVRSFVNPPSIRPVLGGSASFTHIQDAEVHGLRREIHVFRSTDALCATLIPLSERFHFTVIISGATSAHSKINSYNAGDLQRIFENASGRENIKVHAIGPESSPRAIWLAKNFRQHHVLLVGGGAYSYPYLHGSDSSAGIDDSLNLAWKLALVCKGVAPQDLLDTYELERLPVVAESLGLSDLLHLSPTSLLSSPIGAAKNGPRPATPSQSLAGGSESNPLWALRSFYPDFTVNYRHSPIVTDDRDSGLGPFASQSHSTMKPSISMPLINTTGHSRQIRAGDRTPDVTGLVTISTPVAARRPRGLYELLAKSSGTHIILIFPPSGGGVDGDEPGRTLNEAFDVLEAHVLRGVAQVIFILPNNYLHPTPTDIEITVMIDTTGEARSAFGLGDAVGGQEFGMKEMVYVVVRPDGFIGCFGTEVASVDRYFSDIYCC